MLGSIPDYTTCPGCGTSVAPAALGGHRCDDRHRHDHVDRIATVEAARFDEQLASWLESPEGRLAALRARRGRDAG